MSSSEKARWTAEVKFLKAYYHFWLLRMYGPIPLIKNNLAITADVKDIKQIERNTIDECMEYIVQLLDEAAVDLQDIVQFEIQEAGRITKPIALSVKALVLRSEEHTSELQSLMRISYAVFCLKQKN